MNPSSRTPALGYPRESTDNHTITRIATVVPFAYIVCVQILESNPWNLHTTQEHMPRNTCKITGQQRAMFNKIVNINHTKTKFATIVPYTCVIMCTHLQKLH